MYEGGSPDIEIMLPDDVDADVVGSDITVHDQQRIHVITELNWQAIAAVLGEHEELSVARLRKARLIVHSDGAEPESESLLSCILCEVERGSDRYLHENGRWKRYSRNLIQMLDLTLDENEIDSYPNPLPSWDPEWDEDEYNQATAKDFNMLCLDKVLWKESRHGSGIEICDLLTESGDIIHVKKFRNTQSMSHFAHQVETSARALAQHGGAKEWLGRKRQENNWNALPTIHGRQVILAIGSNRDGKLSQSPPTGSKFALSRAIISLNAFGFKPILQRIPIERTVNVTAIQQLAVPVRSGMTQTTGH